MLLLLLLTMMMMIMIMITSAKEVVFVCLSVSQQDNLESYGRIFLKFCGYVGHGTNYQ